MLRDNFTIVTGYDYNFSHTQFTENLVHIQVSNPHLLVSPERLRSACVAHNYHAQSDEA
jgi:hypothetical protein